MTAVAVDTIAKPEPKRDRWGRYLIPNAAGKPVGHTRATTIAGTLDNRYNLELWQQRMVAVGIGQRPDLHALATTLNPDTDKKALNQLCKDALSAAQSDAKANLGTALHSMTEHIDAGNKTPADFPQWTKHLERYSEALHIYGVEIDPNLMEQTVIDDGYTVAGTFDRVATLSDGRRVIADIKTGGTLDFSWLSISVQLAMYANHTATWDPATETRGERIDVDRKHALVIHLPAGEPDPHCHLYLVDIHEGYGNYMTAHEVRAARNHAKKLGEMYTPRTVGTGGATATYDWLAGRITALAAKNDQAVVDLRNRWPETVPQPLPKEPTEEQITAMDAALSKVESSYDMPFDLGRPGTQPTTKKQGKRNT